MVSGTFISAPLFPMKLNNTEISHISAQRMEVDELGYLLESESTANENV